MKKTKNHSMVIDGLFSVEVIDASAEVVKIAGMNIDDYKAGQMLANWEHNGTKSDNHSPKDYVGKVIYCKKILKADDCENDRQLRFYELFKKPCLYGMVRLFDAAGHSSAQDLAAIIRDHYANNEPIVIRFSVEGSTLDKKDNVINECIVKHVAMTVRPCNKAAISNLVSDPNAPKGFDKIVDKEESVLLNELLTEQLKNENEKLYSYEKLGNSVENNYAFIKEKEYLDKIKLLVKAKLLISESVLNKAITAGGMNAAPSSLVGGSSLQSYSNIPMSNPFSSPKPPKNKQKKKKSPSPYNTQYSSQVMSSIRDYSPISFSKEEFKGILKNKLKDVSDDYLDHFVDLAHDIHMKKKLLKIEYLCLELGQLLEKATKQIKIEGVLTISDVEEEKENHKFKLEHSDNSGLLEINGNSIMLNGIPITMDDLKDIVNESNAGKAKISYNQEEVKQ